MRSTEFALAKLALVLLCVQAALVSAQQQAQQTTSQQQQQTSSQQQQQQNSTTAANASGTSRPATTGSANVTSATPFVTTSLQIIGNTTRTVNVTVTPTVTASSFPTAAVITTGALAGTAVAPAPPGQGGGTARGPNDSFVVSAALQAFSTTPLATSVVLGIMVLATVGLLV